MKRSVSIKNISKIPKKPGVYFLKDEKGEVFYVGKANNMRSRVGSHKNNPQSYHPETIKRVDYIVTANEIEALIKESVYIKRLEPKMNYRLRDDKKYFYVGVTKEEKPRVFTTHQPITNTKNKTKIEYFGPYTDGNALKATLKYLRRIFPYYTTNSKRPLSAKKHGPLPCSWCHIKLCPGPDADTQEYKKDIKRIKSILKGRLKTVIGQLEKEMRSASKNMDYERAQEIKSIVDSLKNIFEHKDFVLPWSPSKLENDSTAWGGEYLANLLGLNAPIKTIEGYDVSNIQGKEPTASMVRFKDGVPDKSLYRKFNIKAEAEPNDYLMMAEAVRRRLKNDWPLPDLILIDGGAGQLNAALQQLRMLRVKCPIVALAKKEEELYIPGRKKPIHLSEMPQKVQNVLQHVRDEAHRFAVAHHRKKHSEKFQPYN